LSVADKLDFELAK